MSYMSSPPHKDRADKIKMPLENKTAIDHSPHIIVTSLQCRNLRSNIFSPVKAIIKSNYLVMKVLVKAEF